MRAQVPRPCSSKQRLTALSTWFADVAGGRAFSSEPHHCQPPCSSFCLVLRENRDSSTTRSLGDLEKSRAIKYCRCEMVRGAPQTTCDPGASSCAPFLSPWPSGSNGALPYGALLVAEISR